MSVHRIAPKGGKMPDNDSTEHDTGGGGGDDDMEKRLTAVEHAVIRIDATLEFMRENMATKAFVSEAINGQIKWIVGTAVTLGATAIVVMTFVLNNAVPKALAAAVQMPPIIINAPGAQGAAAVPAASGTKP